MNTPESNVNNNPSPPPKPSRWRKAVFALKAVEVRLRFIGILVVIGLVFGYWDTLRNYWDKWTRPAQASAALAWDTEFYCPMHPDVVRDTLDPDGSIPGCPICGMPLSKREKGAAPDLMPGVLSRVEMSPVQVRMAGIATAKVSYQPLVRELSTVGYVAYDEAKLSEVVTRASGYIEKLYVDETFQTVAKGDPLAEVYSPELYKAVQEFILLRDSRDLGNLVDSARQKLRLLGVSETEIDEIWNTGKSDARLVIRSPQSGHVIKKNVVEGSRIAEGQTLFELAELSTVWVEADVHEKDLSLLREGQPIQATITAYPDRTFEGTVALIHPHLERATRTNRVRFELENPDHLLRPGMYATVRLTRPVAETEPFETMIAKRQAPPENADAPALIAWQGDCPVTGLKLGSMGTPLPVSLGGETVYLCCDGCTDEIQQSPQKYVAKLDPPPEDAVLTVPQSAVIDTGERTIVYVERQPGVFEGVEVTLGPEVGNRYPVLTGLSPGDQVAAAGAFLIDAETRLNPAAGSAYFGATGGPESSAGGSVQRSEDDEDSEQDEPESVLDLELTTAQLAEIAKLAPEDRKAAREQKLCPVTEMPLGSMGQPIKVTVEGETVFLCCKGCIEAIQANPETYLNKLNAWHGE